MSAYAKNQGSAQKKDGKDMLKGSNRSWLERAPILLVVSGQSEHQNKC